MLAGAFTAALDAAKGPWMRSPDAAATPLSRGALLTRVNEAVVLGSAVRHARMPHRAPGHTATDAGKNLMFRRLT